MTLCVFMLHEDVAEAGVMHEPKASALYAESITASI